VGTGGDNPSKANKETHEVKNGDIIIVGSDGLFDNLFDPQIIDLLRPFIRDRDELLDAGLVAELISQEAEKFSNNQNWSSPFAKSAHDHFFDFSGGKPDDITVVVSQIKLAEKI
jgi:protein phosphatase PTC7